MTEDEFKSALSYVRGQKSLYVPNGRWSPTIEIEIAAHLAARSANIFPILEEIAGLDGARHARPSRTKLESLFRRPWLRGLWHKHYTQARFIPHNLQAHWEKHGLEKLLGPMRRGREFFEPDDAGEIAHRLVIDSYLARSDARQMTGEWIVFARVEGLNYYLTLADHTEDDREVWTRCQAAAALFPEVELLAEQRHGIEDDPLGCS